MRTVDEARAVPGPELPVYQATVLAEPLTSVVADPSGELPTRSGCVADTVPVNPSAAKAAAFELVTVRPAASSACSVIAPPEMVEGDEVPLIASILESSVWTLSVTLTWLLPLAPEATKLICWPLTVMVLPAAKSAASELVAAAPDKVVAPVIGAAALLLAAVPIAVSVLKKLSPAATADAATSAVLASVPIELFSAAFRLAAVAVGVVPIVKLPVGGGAVFVAVN